MLCLRTSSWLPTLSPFEELWLVWTSCYKYWTLRYCVTVAVLLITTSVLHCTLSVVQPTEFAYFSSLQPHKCNRRTQNIPLFSALYSSSLSVSYTPHATESVLFLPQYIKDRFTHSMSCPCRAAKGLECAFPVWFTQSDRVWFTLAMPCNTMPMPYSDHATIFKATAQHGLRKTACGYLPAFGFFRLPREVPRRLLSEAYLSSSQRSTSTTVKSGSSTLQKWRSVTLLD
jgi:hypothetical protein